MKSQVLTLLTILVAMAWWLFSARLALFKSRLARALRVAGIVYLAMMAVRLATHPIDQDQLQLAGLSLALFGALWVVAWIITRVLSKR